MKIVNTIILILFQIVVFSQTKLDTIGINRLNGGIKALSLDADLMHASWGFCITDPKTGKIISEYNSEKSLMPASNMKVVTTITALNLLGENYTYSTAIEYDGTITKEGVLDGNLYIRGSGDPSLGSSRMDSTLRFDSLFNVWAIEIKNKGIKKINGNIIADASAFEDYGTPGSWNWDDIGQYYGAGPLGLNVYENKYTIYYSTGSSVSKVDSIFPAIDGLTVYNDVKVGGSGDAAYIYGAPDNYYRYVVGSIPSNKKAYEVDGSMPDAPLFAALELKKALTGKGDEVVKQATTVYAMKREKIEINNQRKLLFEYRSPILKDIVYHTNQKSVNLYAEALLKTTGMVVLNDGSREAGAKAITTYWANRNIDLTGFNMEDGSGLSRLNVVTAKQMCGFLNYELKQPTFAAFKYSLPIAGQTGTLKTIADGTAASGKIFAKSGSMFKVRSYSGYVQTKSGDMLTFCVIVNNYTCGTAEIKSKLEKLMVWMVGL
ncbi:MAG: D-alanyl-D-alanine carboxypeptidase/D-alanyl-D-alanine-endopeptidase [Chitinophagales bacterium]